MSAKVDAILIANGIKPDENHLEQHGVKGMKWGVRKRRDSPSGSAPKSARRAKTPPTKVPNTFKNKPSNRRMSDAELRNRLNRLQMEKQYKELTTPQTKGRGFVREILEDSGKQAARQLTQTAVKVGLQLALEGAAKSAKGPTGTFLAEMAAQGAKKKKG